VLIICTALSSLQLHNTRRLVQASVLGSLIDFEPTHTLHTQFGMIALACSFIHAVGWIVRIVHYGTAGFLYHHQVCSAQHFITSDTHAHMITSDSALFHKLIVRTAAKSSLASYKC
jgi:hypothetical protein